ncbi:MAG: alpha/beta hydrolase family protein [Candidatus Merdivicinus sp.]
MNKVYTSMEKFSRLFQKTERSCAFSAENLDAYAEWKTRTRNRLAELTGLNRLEKCELCPELISSEELSGEPFIRHKYRIQTEEGVWMPFYVLEPQNGDAKKPVMICPHGHGSGGKAATGGLSDIPEVAESIAEYHYDYAFEFARRGFLVFCPDARGFGERREIFEQDHLMMSSCRVLNQMAISLGLTVTGMWTFDLMRLIDYIETREDCDINRLGCAGLSGGGLQTLWLSAMDDRVKAAVVSGYFYGYHDSLLLLSNNCSCNYVPHLWETVDMGDIGALIAPRPLMIETGDQDPLNGARGVANVTSQMDITRKAYRLFGAEEKLAHSLNPGVHRWYGRDSYDFICNALHAGNGERK